MVRGSEWVHLASRGVLDIMLTHHERAPPLPLSLP
jgi:hypothetical protein